MCIAIDDINSDVVRAALSIGDKLVDKIYLFGSYARNDYDEESDIDYMIIIDCPNSDVSMYNEKMLEKSDEIGLDNDILVSVLVRDKQSFDKGKEYVPLYKNILREGVTLYG